MKSSCLIFLCSVSCLLNAVSSNTRCQESWVPSLDHFSKQLPDYPVYPYPYQDLGAFLKNKDKKYLWLFSYGSLMDKNSASRTLSSKSLHSFCPAIGFGIKRLFNRDVPLQQNSHWDLPENPRSRGMLNVQRSSDIRHCVNGVLIQVPLEEIQYLLKREVGYDLIPIVAATWEQLCNSTQPEWKIAYTLSALESSLYVNDEILPRPGYYELVCKAASHYGSLFELLWYLTTYLADGKTTICDWEEKNNQRAD
jgi:hypothetical protein